MSKDIEAQGSGVTGNSLERDPRIAMAALWRSAVALDKILHSRILARYPRLLSIVDWILEFLYALFASPITALVVSFLLVPFVLSGSIPVIIWFSATVAWVLCTVAVARAAPMKQLSIISRSISVVIVAGALFGLSRLYIRWSLLSYYAHTPQQAASSNPKPSTSGIGSVDLDQFGPRLDDLLRKELRKLVPPPQRTTVPDEHAAGKLSTLSGDLLVKMVPDVTNSLRMFRDYGWAGEDRNWELRSYDDYEHEEWNKIRERLTQYPILKTQEEWKEDKLKIDARYRAQFVQLLSDADTLRRELINRLPKGAKTPDDDAEDALFAKALADGSAVPSGIGCCPPSVKSAADYLDSLAKRVGRIKTLRD